jgi:hypothetical protein
MIATAMAAEVAAIPIRRHPLVVSPSAARLASTSEFHLHARHAMQAAKTKNIDLVRFAAMSRATKPTEMSRFRTEKTDRRGTMRVHSVAHKFGINGIATLKSNAQHPRTRGPAFSGS